MGGADHAIFDDVMNPSKIPEPVQSISLTSGVVLDFYAPEDLFSQKIIDLF